MPSQLTWKPDRPWHLLTARSDINALILDYLTMEGYPKAAAKFSKEANLQPQQKDSLIVARQEIKQAILEGRIDAAITSLNDLDPEVRVFASPLAAMMRRRVSCTTPSLQALTRNTTTILSTRPSVTRCSSLVEEPF